MLGVWRQKSVGPGAGCDAAAGGRLEWRHPGAGERGPEAARADGRARPRSAAAGPHDGGAVGRPGSMRAMWALLLALLLTALPGFAQKSSYTLGPDDQITIQALEAEEISGKPIRIGSDGYIKMPMVG